MIRREDYQYLRKLNDFRYFSIEQFDKIVGQMEFRKAKKDHILFLREIKEISFSSDLWLFQGGAVRSIRNLHVYGFHQTRHHFSLRWPLYR